jgi:uncharacterized protein YcbK (DUF882 family)
MSVEAPPYHIWVYVFADLLDFLQKAGSTYQDSPFRVTSWWRSVEKNASLPGAEPFSQHLVGLAIDAVPYNGSSSQLAAAARRHGLIGVVYDTHAHLQAWEAGRLERLLRA